MNHTALDLLMSTFRHEFERLIEENLELRRDVERLAGQADDALELVGTLRRQLAEATHGATPEPAESSADTVPRPMRAASPVRIAAECRCGCLYTDRQFAELELRYSTSWGGEHVESRTCSMCSASVSAEFAEVAA